MLYIKDEENLKMPFRGISRATDGFSDANLIGNGGFGKVYKGISKKHGCIAVKRLDRSRGQGDREFKMEIALLSKHKHENIVSLLGFCEEDDEKILVYKYESNGSLDTHLNKKDLTWIQRLQICLDVARGLKYLLDDVKAQPKIFHRDIKSSNILLDEDWKAKISDFGLSREVPRNTSSFVISDPCGTTGYVDPDYYLNGYLTQKSDVYSFGVVLWEVLCGRLEHVKYKDDPLPLRISVQKHYNDQTLHLIIPSDLYEQINKDSLATFSDIAYQCLKNGVERPKMKQVMKQLEKALHYQVQSCGSSHQVQVVGDKVLNKFQTKSRPNVKHLSRILEEPTDEPTTVEQGKHPKQEVKKDKEHEEKKAEGKAKPTPGDRKGKELEEQSQEIVLGVSIDCAACARNVKKCLKGFEGVEEVHIDYDCGKVVVKGNKDVDPLEVKERVHKAIKRKVELLLPVSKLQTDEHKNKLHQKLELLSPLGLKQAEECKNNIHKNVELLSPPVPKPHAEEHKTSGQKTSGQELPPKHKNNKNEAVAILPVITVILKVNVCCKGCSRKIKKCIMDIKGVESVVPDIENSQVVVRGTIRANELVDRVYKGTGKRAEILKQDPNPKQKEVESG